MSFEFAKSKCSASFIGHSSHSKCLCSVGSQTRPFPEASRLTGNPRPLRKEVRSCGRGILEKDHLQWRKLSPLKGVDPTGLSPAPLSLASLLFSVTEPGCSLPDPWQTRVLLPSPCVPPALSPCLRSETACSITIPQHSGALCITWHSHLNVTSGHE